MELGKLIKVNFQGDCFYCHKAIRSESFSRVKDTEKLQKTHERYLENALKFNANFHSTIRYDLFGPCTSTVGEEQFVAESLIHSLYRSLQSANKQLVYTRNKIKKMTKEEYNSLLEKSESCLSIRFCKIKVTNAPDFDYVFCFVKDEGDFPKTITEYFKKLQEKHPRKYLKYRIQFTGKF